MVFPCHALLDPRLQVAHRGDNIEPQDFIRLAQMLARRLAMSRRILTIALLLCFGLWANPGAADLVVTLKDGRTIRVPVEAAEVASISFADGETQTGTTPSLPAAPQPLPTSPLAANSGRDYPKLIRVAPGTAVPAPSAAARVAKDGDTVEIAAAVYKGDVAVWTQNDLTLKGVDGRPHLVADGRSAEAKAIWVIRGNNVTVDNIEFSGAKVDDRNGAGIRSEGSGLTVENSYFHNNQMGIMSGAKDTSDIVIRKSQFTDNFLDDGSKSLGHNLYIGAARSLTVIDSTFTGARVGHNLKSRAAKTTLINNKFVDGPDGRASYLVDIPAGGIATLKGNTIHKGDKPENTSLVSYGAEKRLYNDNRLTIVGNTFVNDYRNGIFVDNKSDTPAEIVDNTFTGPGQILRGPGTIVTGR